MCKTHTDPPANTKAIVWHPDDNAQPTPSNPKSGKIFRPEVLETMEAKMREMDSELRALSLDIHCMDPSTP